MKSKIVYSVYHWKIIIFLIIGSNQTIFSQFNVVQTTTLDETITCVANMPANVMPSQSNFDHCDLVVGWVAVNNFTVPMDIRFRTRLFINGAFQWEHNWPSTSLSIGIGGSATHCIDLNTNGNSGNYHVDFFIYDVNNNIEIFAGSADANVDDHPDYAPLMALYNSTNGPGWTNKTGWIDGAAGTNCDPCSGWYGVTCTNGRVTCLDLDGSPTCNAGFSSGGNNLSGHYVHDKNLMARAKSLLLLVYKALIMNSSPALKTLFDGLPCALQMKISGFFFLIINPVISIHE